MARRLTTGGDYQEPKSLLAGRSHFHHPGNVETIGGASTDGACGYGWPHTEQAEWLALYAREQRPLMRDVAHVQMIAARSIDARSEETRF